jgi:acetate kinase
MGFTPLEGIVMATRAGTVDPGLLLWLVENGGLSAREVWDGVDRHSGLLGLAGTKDMREVLGRAEAGDADATLALEVYLHRLVGGLAAMAAALGGVDALVFTGGVGERSAEVRRLAVDRLGFLGLRLDPDVNATVEGDAEVTADGSVGRVLVVAAREDIEIARGVRDALT